MSYSLINFYFWKESHQEKYGDRDQDICFLVSFKDSNLQMDKIFFQPAAFTPLITKGTARAGPQIHMDFKNHVICLNYLLRTGNFTQYLMVWFPVGKIPMGLSYFLVVYE